MTYVIKEMIMPASRLKHVEEKFHGFLGLTKMAVDYGKDVFDGV